MNDSDDRGRVVGVPEERPTTVEYTMESVVVRVHSWTQGTHMCETEEPLVCGRPRRFLCLVYETYGVPL